MKDVSQWPGKWISGREKMKADGRTLNDNGIVWLFGDIHDGEWLQMADIPERLQNNP